MAIDSISTVPSGRTREGTPVLGFIFLYSSDLFSPLKRWTNLYYGVICLRLRAILALQAVELLKKVYSWYPLISGPDTIYVIDIDYKGLLNTVCAWQ